MMKRFYIIILFLAFALKVSSQVYPVSVMVNLTPPYPSTLDGFADISSNKISLQITVNDLTLSGYPVKLRLVMKSNSVTITTSQAFITNPILINGGESIILTSADLAEYFRLENLDFSGFSKNQYLKTGQLPDGIYQITFEVVDYHRNFVISSSRFPAFAYIFVNDPPILNMPFDRAQINITGQQNILFNWTFRHSPFSRPGFIPEYRFEMWEVYPENMDPYAVALATQPVYSTTVNSTTFNYTVMEPSLIPGRKYAWRVTVIDPEGITAFKEGGRSALRWFQYGTACDAPLIKAGAIGASHINVEWETKQYQTNFRINYKPVNMEGGDWYSGTTSMQNFRIENLRPNTEYYVEVKGTCGTQESPASERLRLRTKQDLTFECGNPGNIPEITNRNPLMQLKRGDYIKAGDFEVEIYEAQGSNGTFSGKGFILVPLFKFIKLEADLNNIQVNTDYQLMGGSIKTVYNLSNSLMLNMTDIFGGGSLMKKENNPFADIADIKINAPDSIQSVIISGNSVVVNTAQGTVTESVSEDKIVAITAPSGKQYVVDGATKTVYAQSTPSGAAPSKGVDVLKQPSDSEKKFVVSFDASGQQIYGFDKPDVQNMPADNYKTRITNGQMAYVPWKSVESGRFDRLDAIINGEPADSVFFSRQSRNMVMVSKGTDDSRRSLLISGGNNNDEDELYAWYTYNGNEQDTNKNIYYAGSVNIVSYDQISADLCLVSVNGSAVPADKAAVEAFLNKVYAPAVAKWNVTYLEGGLSVTLESGSGKKIDNTDPDDRMDYTPDMKLVNRAMKDHPAYNRHTVYLFFFDQGTDAAVAGYMPLNGRFGYITGYTAARQAEYYRTIAHEVAHGVFNLRHTFSHENRYVLPEGTTDNLLDYNGGTALYKYQWDLIHDPGWHLGWFDKEEDAAMMAVSNIAALNELKNTDNTYSFINPAGKIVTLPARTTCVVFCTYDRYFKKEGEALTPIDFSSPIGSLIAFTLDNKSYSARADVGRNSFIGYACNDGTKESDYYLDEISFGLKPSKGISLIPTLENNQFVGYAALFAPTDNEVKEKSKGSGTLQKGLFIQSTETSDLIKTVKDYLAGKAEKAVRVTDVAYLTQKDFATINTAPPQKADDFLKSVLNENSPMADVLVYFALVYKTPEAIAAIQGCNNENIAENHQIILAEFHRNLASILSGNGPADMTTADKLAEEFKAISYRSFNEIEAAGKLKDIVTKAQTIEEVKTGLEQYNSTCVFSALDKDARIKILDWLFKSDNDYWTVNDKNIVYELLKNAPATHTVDLLKAFMSNNYKWLYTLWDEGSEAYREKVIDLLAELVKANYGSLGITPTSKQVYIFDTWTFADVPVAQSPFCIGLKEGSPVNVDYNYTIERGTYDDAPSIDFEETGKIRFIQEYTLQDNTTTVRAKGTRDITRKVREKIDYSLQPFEPVTIYFGRNYSMLGEIKTDQPYIVPAIWALRMADATSDEEFSENLRTAGNITAIVLTPFTAGGSSAFITFMGQLGTAVALADIAIQKERNNTAPEAYKDQEFYEAWDMFYTAVLVADGAAAVTNVARSITIPRTFAELNSKVSAKWANFPTTLRTAWTDLKALRGATAVTGTLGKVTPEIVKQKLPTEFVDALKTLGKSEDKILDYFMKYHNDNNYRFFNEVEELVVQYPSLTRAEAYTLWGYTTDNFYLQLNDWLRRGVNASQTQGIKDILQSALSKVPKYTDGIAYRAVGFEPTQTTELAEFLSKHQKGKIVKYDEFVSCGSSKEAAFYDKATKNVRIIIEDLKPAPDISPFADGIKFRGYTPKELLLEPGRSFEVIDYFELNGIHYIKLKQL